MTNNMPIELFNHDTLPEISDYDFYCVYNQNLISNLNEIKKSFKTADPFPHVYIPSFLNNEFAESLLAEFPKHDDKFSTGESKQIELNSIFFDYSSKSNSTVFKMLKKATESKNFIQLMSQISSIQNLTLPPDSQEYEIKQSLANEQMEPHIDHNFHYNGLLHRRLNLIVYLNKDWKLDFGGNIEIHSNPRDPWSNQVKTYLADFNSAILFATGHNTWHGFKKIKIPSDYHGNSRKSIALYMYTPDRPQEEIRPGHPTIWVPRFIDKEKFKPGATLTAEMLLEIEELLIRSSGRLTLTYDSLIAEMNKNNKYGQINTELINNKNQFNK